MWKSHFCFSVVVTAFFLFSLALAMAAFIDWIFILFFHPFISCIPVFATSIPPIMRIRPYSMSWLSIPVIARAVIREVIMNMLDILSAPLAARISMISPRKNITSMSWYMKVFFRAVSMKVTKVTVSILYSPPCYQRGYCH